MKRLTTMGAVTALALLTGCSTLPDVSQWQMPWQGGNEADQEKGGALAESEPVSRAIKGAAAGLLSASEAVANGLRAEAKCIEPRSTMQFAGDHRCDQPDPVWSAASHEASVTLASAAHFGAGGTSTHVAAYHATTTGFDSRQSAGRSGVDRMARAWSRYCDSGRGMTDEDWSLVAAAGESIPDHLQSTCIPPK